MLVKCIKLPFESHTSELLDDVKEILKDRLESSFYDEDRTETHQAMYNHSFSNPSDALSVCYYKVHRYNR